MRIFSVFRKKENSNDLEFVFPVQSEKKLILRSSDLYKLSTNNVIDTLDEEVIAKYISNVHLLRNKVKDDVNTLRLATIRNDDFFPEDFVWQENSEDTYGEFVSIPLSFALKEAIAKEKMGLKDKNEFGFAIPGLYDEDKYNTEMRNLRGVGNIYTPVKFRTTKHFTMNTPLGYTGEYNQVKSDRKYTIIDSADGVINSPYTYSISGRDAYLDVTHEGLPISSSAIILISEDYFNEIKEDREMMELLNKRKLIVYKGDLNVAVNMILTENGMLPFRPGMGIEYDELISEITTKYLKEISATKGYEYDKGHGNMFGKGGHFTDLIDTRYNQTGSSYASLADFLNLNANLPYEISEYMLLSEDTASKIVSDIGTSRLLELINSYNTNAINMINNKRKKFNYSKSNIPEDTSALFRSTVMLIKAYFKENESIPNELWESIYHFYTESDINTQALYASHIKEELREYEDSVR